LLGLQGRRRAPHFPGFTIEAQRGTPTIVTYNNDLPLAPVLQQYLTVDQTLHWADPLEQMGSVAPYAGPRQ
jgi:spore coat protein A, manganese oxidase